MKLLMQVLALCGLLFWAVTVAAQLPAPTPEEAAKKQAAAEKKAAADDAAKQALAKAQDRVARRYRAAHPNAPKPVPIVTPPVPGK